MEEVSATLQAKLSSVSEKLPSFPSLEEIWDSLPREIYQKSNLKACKSFLFPIMMCVTGYLTIGLMPWYFLPLGWLLVAIAASGFFSIGYGCSQQLMFKDTILNEIIGEVCLTPLMYPFASWRNRVINYSSLKDNYVTRIIKGRFWWLSSMWEWVLSICNFEWVSNPRVIASFVCMYTFAFIFFPLMVYNLGVWGLFKFYFIPFVIYHFWLSTVLKLKYGLPNVVDLRRIPEWFEYLTSDVSYVFNSVSELSAQIPTYNLREAYCYIQDWYEKQSNLSTLVDEYEIVVRSGDKLIHLNKKMVSKSINKSLLAEICWPTTIFLVTVPVLAIYGLFTVSYFWQTFLLSFIWYNLGGVSITAGYHRLFSHRAYDAAWPVRAAFAFFGSATFEMSVLDWCADHRVHHRYTDTNKDPYTITKGFWWAHIGWLIFQRDEEVNQAVSRSDISDLKKDPILRFQHKYYLLVALFAGFICPTLIAGLGWGDYWGGFLIGGCLAVTAIQHCTFCVNSVAHYFGELTYSDQRTPRDAFWVSLVTFGEGYHNFHHEFPYDYRNGVNTFAWDPSKWLIKALSVVGLTYNLQTFPDEFIQKGKIQMQQQDLDKQKAKWDWGPDDNSLPNYSMSEFLSEVNESGKRWMVIEGYIHDVDKFVDVHPGGPNFIKTLIGKDATNSFQTVYKHSNAARNWLKRLRVGRLSVDKKWKSN